MRCSWLPLRFVFAVRHPRDKACATLKREVIPKPVESDDKAVAQPDQKIDVREAPEDPAYKASQLQAAKFDDGGPPADRREVTEMHVTKWLGCPASCDVR